MKSNIDLKREYYDELGFEPELVEHLVASYGERAATLGEAAYVLRQRFLEFIRAIIDQLAVVFGRAGK